MSRLIKIGLVVGAAALALGTATTAEAATVVPAQHIGTPMQPRHGITLKPGKRVPGKPRIPREHTHH
jgi:hypothetical protein